MGYLWGGALHHLWMLIFSSGSGSWERGARPWIFGGGVPCVVKKYLTQLDVLLWKCGVGCQQDLQVLLQ